MPRKEANSTEILLKSEYKISVTPHQIKNTTTSTPEVIFSFAFRVFSGKLLLFIINPSNKN